MHNLCQDGKWHGEWAEALPKLSAKHALVLKI